MPKAQFSNPQKSTARVHEEAKEHVHAFIRRLETRSRSRFTRLCMRAFSRELAFIDGDGSSHRKEKEIELTVDFSRPCTKAAAQKTFKTLIDSMKAAGHRCRFTPAKRSATGKTHRYELRLIQEDAYERNDRSKPGKRPGNTRLLKWSNDCWATTKTHTAEIHKEKEKDGAGAYSIVIFTRNSRTLRVSKANSLKEAQEKIKLTLG